MPFGGFLRTPQREVLQISAKGGFPKGKKALKYATTTTLRVPNFLGMAAAAAAAQSSHAHAERKEPIISSFPTY